MILHYMSASRIKTYLQCAEQYFQRYENGVKGGALHLTFGTLVHKVFERYFQEDIDIVELYEQEWTKADIADPEFFRDGFSIIENFKNMTNRDAVNIGFELPFAINIETGHVYDASVVDFENNKEGSKAFLKMLEEEDAPIIFGFIDRIEYDVARDRLRIIDYKTSRVPLTQAEANEDIQLSMYALVAMYLFPEYADVKLELHYVREGTPVVTSRTDEELEVYRKWLISIFHKIRNDKDHHATLNRYCGWCDAKAGCATYNELVNSEADPDFKVENITFSELDEQLEKLAVHIKILEGRKKEIETIFKERLKETDNSPISTGKGERYLSNNQRINYDVETVIRNFPPEKLSELISVNKTAVDKLAKGNTELMQELVDTGTKYYIAPTLRKGKGSK